MSATVPSYICRLYLMVSSLSCAVSSLSKYILLTSKNLSFNVVLPQCLLSKLKKESWKENPLNSFKRSPSRFDIVVKSKFLSLYSGGTCSTVEGSYQLIDNLINLTNTSSKVYKLICKSLPSFDLRLESSVFSLRRVKLESHTERSPLLFLFTQHFSIQLLKIYKLRVLYFARRYLRLLPMRCRHRPLSYTAYLFST